MKTFIVIAAYNEENSIAKVIRKLKKEGYQNIVVVDDGSKDKTYEQASKEKIYALQHIINRGQGAALRTGTEFALLKGAEIIVHFDADGQHKAEEIKRFTKPIENKKYDVITGSRFLGKVENIGLLRKIILKLGVVVLLLLYRIKLTDSQNGFRAFSKKATKKIKWNADRMEHAGEILGEIKKSKLKYKEVPVTILYTDYSVGKKGENSQPLSASIKLGLKMIFRKLVK